MQAREKLSRVIETAHARATRFATEVPRLQATLGQLKAEEADLVRRLKVVRGQISTVEGQLEELSHQGWEIQLQKAQQAVADSEGSHGVATLEA